MRRQVLVAAIALVLVVAGVIVARRGRAPETPATPGVDGARVFVSDSIGVRLRLPPSEGWTFRPEPSGPDGRVVAAMHSSERAMVRVFALPVTPATTLDMVFQARKQQIANVFGASDLDKIIASELHNETKTINNRVFRQWQAISQPAAEVGQSPTTIVFMWLLTVDPVRSLECIGLVRAPVTPTPEEQQATDALLRDVAYILQSFEVR